MRFARLAGIALVGLIAGCKSSGGAAAPAPPPALAAAPAAPVARPAFRLGSADELGWKLYQRDRTMAGMGEPAGATYVSHE
jgi:hypothetical protein